ncbi:hypothetical protein A2U01_0045784, partial [Trifolium medium]|nr:hypothetical protein [Trifolium medium]
MAGKRKTRSSSTSAIGDAVIDTGNSNSGDTQTKSTKKTRSSSSSSSGDTQTKSTKKMRSSSTSSQKKS